MPDLGCGHTGRHGTLVRSVLAHRLSVLHTGGHGGSRAMVVQSNVEPGLKYSCGESKLVHFQMTKHSKRMIIMLMNILKYYISITVERSHSTVFWNC